MEVAHHVSFNQVVSCEYVEYTFDNELPHDKILFVIVNCFIRRNKACHLFSSTVDAVYSVHVFRDSYGVLRPSNFWSHGCDETERKIFAHLPFKSSNFALSEEIQHSYGYHDHKGGTVTIYSLQQEITASQEKECCKWHPLPLEVFMLLRLCCVHNEYFDAKLYVGMHMIKSRAEKECWVLHKILCDLLSQKQ